MPEFRIDFFSNDLGWSFAFQTNDSRLYQDVRFLLSMFCGCESTAKLQECVMIQVICIDNIYSIEYRGKTFFANAEENYDRLLYIVYEMILLSFQESNSGLAVFHGAALSEGDDCIGLIAPTRTGKTTFTLHLVKKGFSYMSDDYLLYDPVIQKCIAFPKPAAIRDSRYLPETNQDGLRAVNGEGLDVMLVRPSRYTPIQERKALRAVIFLERKDISQPYKIRRLSAARLYQNMIFGSHFGGDIRINRSILSIIPMVQGYCLTYRSGWEVFDQLDLAAMLGKDIA